MRRTQMTRPNSVSTVYAYDSLSHLTSVLHQLSGSTMDDAAYTLDNAGNRKAKTDELTGVTEGQRTDTAMGLGVGDYASFGTEGNTNENGFSGEINANANFPGIGSLRWSPTKPGEPPHGVLGAGAAGFAGVGATAYSSAPCGCAVE